MDIMIIENIKEILKENNDITDVFKRNLVKEYLQILTLSFLYNSENYKELIFYGGSALRHLYGINRLSEDLDFVDINKEVNLSIISKDLKSFFYRKYGLNLITKVQKFRLVMKFKILKELGIKGPSEFLHLKLEIFKDFNFKGYNLEKKPIFKFGQSVVVRTFDLPTLMATKINAILNRKWEKTSKTGEILATVKGRDYYDLMWYFQNGVVPNLNCVKNVKNVKELKESLIRVVNKVDVKSIKYDLDGLISDENLVKNIAENIKEILLDYVNNIKE